jgi:hypothetical protein
MAAGAVKIDGLAEFRRALQASPALLTAEAEPIIAETSAKVFQGLKADYPEGETGNLLRGVKLEQTGPLSWRVRSTGKISIIFEKGTFRRYTRRSGANRGVMPAADILIPLAVRYRAIMVSRLEAMAERQTGATFASSAGV